MASSVGGELLDGVKQPERDVVLADEESWVALVAVVGRSSDDVLGSGAGSHVRELHDALYDEVGIVEHFDDGSVRDAGWKGVRPAVVGMS